MCWTAEDHAFADRKIAEHVTAAPEPLTAFRRRDRKPRPVFVHPQDAEIKRLWPMEMPMRELAARVGMEPSAVWKRARRMSLPSRAGTRATRCE